MTGSHHKSGVRLRANDFRDEGGRAKQEARAEKVNAKTVCVCHERQLTVRQGYHGYQLQLPFQQRAPVPIIELKGHWLHKAGFTQQAKVKIRVMHQCLVLTLTDK